MSDEELYQQYLAEEEAKKTKSKAQIMSDIRSEAAAMTTPDNVGGAAANALTLGRGLGSGIFKQAAEGGLLGAAQSPDDRLKGFLTGGALQGGIAGVGKLASKAGSLPGLIGEKLLGIKPEQARAYIKNPQEAERLYGLAKSDPVGLSNAVKQEIKGGLDDIFERVSQPALSRVEQSILGKNIEVQPSFFRGTAAGQEIDRASLLQPKTKQWDLPVEEKYSVSATPVEPQVKYNFPKEPQSILPYGRYQSIDVPVGSVERSIKKTGPESVIEEGYLPKGRQKIEQVLPTSDRISLTGKQALTAKRMSQKAAFDNQTSVLNPMAYRAADDAEAVAAGKLKDALENVSPSIKDDNAILEEAARYTSHAKNTLKNNPAAILSDSDSLGSVPNRSIRQFIDKHGGTGLEDMSKSLSSGRAVNEPLNQGNFIERTVSGPIGKASLRVAPSFENAGRKTASGLENFLAPMSRQIATSAQPQEQDPDYELYQQYLKETGQR